MDIICRSRYYVLHSNTNSDSETREVVGSLPTDPRPETMTPDALTQPFLLCVFAKDSKVVRYVLSLRRIAVEIRHHPLRGVEHNSIPS